MKTALLLAAAGLLAVDLSAQGRVQRPMTFDDFAAVRNVGDPQVSPDGRWVLYSVRTTDVGANRRTTVTKIQAAAGGVAAVIAVTLLAVVGAAIVSRFPRHALGWLLCISPFSIGIASVLGEMQSSQPSA